MPTTLPGLPVFSDSPGFTPVFDGPEIAVTVPFADPSLVNGASYDGVTSALRVTASTHPQLFCVTDILGIASDDLSLPGTLK